MAGWKHIVLNEPERIIFEPAIDGLTPVLFHELAEIIGMFPQWREIETSASHDRSISVFRRDGYAMRETVKTW
jgi:hypothetical protein